MVDTIAQALAEKDPANKVFYLKNAAEYKNKLADLDKRFKETLATAKQKTIIYGGILLSDILQNVTVLNMILLMKVFLLMRSRARKYLVN
jgi:hypothetical protein